MNGYSSGIVTIIILPLTLVSEEAHFLGIGTISRRIYRKSGVPRPFFNKQDIEKDLTKKEKYKFTKNKIPRFPQQKIRPNVLNARKDDCF